MRFAIHEKSLAVLEFLEHAELFDNLLILLGELSHLLLLLLLGELLLLRLPARVNDRLQGRTI